LQRTLAVRNQQLQLAAALDDKAVDELELLEHVGTGHVDRKRQGRNPAHVCEAAARRCRSLQHESSRQSGCSGTVPLGSRTSEAQQTGELQFLQVSEEHRAAAGELDLWAQALHRLQAIGQQHHFARPLVEPIA
jgi:hypothetical protein